VFRSCLLLPGAARLFPAQLHWDGSCKSRPLPQMTGEISGSQQNIEQLVSLRTFQFLAVERKVCHLQRALSQELAHRFRGPVVAGKPVFLPAPALLELLAASEKEVFAAERADLQRRSGRLLAALNAASHGFRHCCDA